eukprot:TRINITY_DN67278_c0_g1_i1.p1 TRINITY_DN67278_c0_g1~~TRINITY_DN67278_c0_g1_i1.p1  ORF type:complete len:412 (-),score=21.73 TRINITY_DN67278_c0_g1_i1:225-1460(-)
MTQELTSHLQRLATKFSVELKSTLFDDDFSPNVAQAIRDKENGLACFTSDSVNKLDDDDKEVLSLQALGCLKGYQDAAQAAAQQQGGDGGVADAMFNKLTKLLDERLPKSKRIKLGRGSSDADSASLFNELGLNKSRNNSLPKDDKEEMGEKSDKKSKSKLKLKLVQKGKEVEYYRTMVTMLNANFPLAGFEWSVVSGNSCEVGHLAQDYGGVKTDIALIPEWDSEDEMAIREARQRWPNTARVAIEVKTEATYRTPDSNRHAENQSAIINSYQHFTKGDSNYLPVPLIQTNGIKGILYEIACDPQLAQIQYKEATLDQILHVVMLKLKGYQTWQLSCSSEAPLDCSLPSEEYRQEFLVKYPFKTSTTTADLNIDSHLSVVPPDMRFATFHALLSSLDNSRCRATYPDMYL